MLFQSITTRTDLKCYKFVGLYFGNGTKISIRHVNNISFPKVIQFTFPHSYFDLTISGG